LSLAEVIICPRAH